MKKFIVTIWKTETYSCDLNVQAETEEAAREIAHQRLDTIPDEEFDWSYEDGDINIDVWTLSKTEESKSNGEGGQ